MSRAIALRITALAALAAGAFALRLLVGYEHGWPDNDDVLRFRLVSAVAAVVVGVCLATSGVYLQTLLRNPLASPYILGLAAGAGVGVAFVAAAWVRLFDQPAPWWSGDLGALVGAVAALAVVYALSQRRGLVDPVSLLLIGVIVSAIGGALIMFLHYLLPAPDSDRLIQWMMGSLSQFTPWRSLAIVGAVAIAGTAFGLVLATALDAAALGDDEARSVGVAIHRLRLILLIISGAMTAAAVTVAGPIGFVGLIAPHLARSIVGARHAGLILAAAGIGAALLLLADAAVRLLPAPYDLMPVGIITSAIGGPTFIWLLRRGRPIG